MHSPTFAVTDACLYRCRLALEAVEELCRIDESGPWETIHSLVVARYIDWITINHKLYDQEKDVGSS